MEGELVSPLLMAPVHIDPSCLHPDLLTEVQHVVIAREQLLLHLNQVIGRGQFPFHNSQNTDFTSLCLPCLTHVGVRKKVSLATILLTHKNYIIQMFFFWQNKSCSRRNYQLLTCQIKRPNSVWLKMSFTAFEQRPIENTLPNFRLVCINVQL